MIIFLNCYATLLFFQAPQQGLIMRGFEIDCRIRHFNGRVQSGEKMKYTK